ncbi:MAG TPA: alpha/beta fold hydrolase [Jiangellales bacterium]|nr:alpha/beta fold hydrolase [Jiangellales bacterium]
MPIRLPRIAKPSRRTVKRRLVPAGVAVALVAGLVGWAVAPAPRSYTTTEAMLTVLSGPSDDEAVTLDTTLYLPKSASAQRPVPAILLAHGFGGTKASVAEDAGDFADRGYAVLAWSARGMGRSGGLIHLNSPDYEVRDAQRLLDWLATQPEIVADGGGDPRVGVVGGSYGGALALMLAGVDPRVDAIVPMITWHDLADAFLPESTGAGAQDGVFKRQWAGFFFGRAGAAGLEGADPGAPGAAADRTDPDRTDDPRVTFDPSTMELGDDPSCGRFALAVCAAYLDVATTGRASPETIALLRQSSPAPTLSRITAPTLLIQGQADSLFPLSDAEANYRAIAATGTPVRMDWFAGGHDGGDGPVRDQDRMRFFTIRWLDFYVKQTGEDPGTAFTYSRVSGFDAETRRVTTTGFRADAVPGATGAPAPGTVRIAGPPQLVFNPPGGNPAAISTLPGTGAGMLATALGQSALDIPGQHANFLSEPLPANTDVVGTPTVQLRAASPTGEAVLFVKLYDVDPDGAASLPFGLAAPVRLTGLPASIDDAAPVTVSLPAIVYRFEEGHRLRLVVATADQAYASPNDPAVYAVALGGVAGTVTLPTLVGEPITDPDVVWRYVLAGVVAAVVLGILTALIVARLRRRRRTVEVVCDHEDTPLVVRGLRKEYGSFVAVASVDFTVHRGQVVGLLGPNGAGKTTSLRVLMGMTRPSQGEILVFGHPLRPGAEVLRRVGALVEGPGFLPHLSGVDNLKLFWRSTGRPWAEAHFDEALDIAGLGTAVHRKVKTYSHGMKQRLAIAQAMLGLPELLVLDEPTDGLDPPQIAEMRRVLRSYATNGRAVLVSSHLLAEVEQTCTHVVVMHKGTVVADGLVDDVIGDSPVARIDVSDVDAARGVLGGLPGVQEVAPDGAELRPAEPAGSVGLVVDLNGTPRTEVVAALVQAGIGVDRVVPRRRLEDAFLALVGGDTRASGER